MKSRDQVTFSPTSCRQTNDGSERTLKKIITTQLAPLVCEVYFVFQTPFVSPSFLKIKYRRQSWTFCCTFSFWHHQTFTVELVQVTNRCAINTKALPKMFYLSGQTIHEQFYPQNQKWEMQDLFYNWFWDYSLKMKIFILLVTRSTRKKKDYFIPDVLCCSLSMPPLTCQSIQTCWTAYMKG